MPKSNPLNYRPISLTSIVVKTLERLVHRDVVSALESQGLLSNYQYGFRAKHSTVSLLQRLRRIGHLPLSREKVFILFFGISQGI